MSRPRLPRGIGLLGATSANMLEMIGVGPFITIPVLLAKMNGPQAMLGWLIGAVVALSDGMVWAELGAAMPGDGGPYRYLSEAYDIVRPFQMPLYPLTPIVAFAGWLFILIASGWKYVAVGVALLVFGIAAYFVRARFVREWPYEARA